jgi:hypothetical protein
MTDEGRRPFPGDSPIDKGAYALTSGFLIFRAISLSAAGQPNLSDCNCLAVRQAARYVTQLYDRHLAASGLRTSQYGTLAKLKRRGPMAINELAAELVIDRTTLGRNIRPLERDGLITITPVEPTAASRNCA